MITWVTIEVPFFSFWKDGTEANRIIEYACDSFPHIFLILRKTVPIFPRYSYFTNQSFDSSRIIQIGLLLEYPVHLIKGPTLLQCIFVLDLHLPILLHLRSNYLHSCPQPIQNDAAGINLGTNPNSEDIETCIRILMHFGKSCITDLLLLLLYIWAEDTWAEEKDCIYL